MWFCCWQFSLTSMQVTHTVSLEIPKFGFCAWKAELLDCLSFIIFLFYEICGCVTIFCLACYWLCILKLKGRMVYGRCQFDSHTLFHKILVVWVVSRYLLTSELFQSWSMWPGNLSTHLLFHPVPTAFPGTPDEPPEHQFLLAWGALESPRLV